MYTYWNLDSEPQALGSVLKSFLTWVAAEGWGYFSECKQHLLFCVSLFQQLPEMKSCWSKKEALAREHAPAGIHFASFAYHYKDLNWALLK